MLQYLIISFICLLPYTASFAQQPLLSVKTTPEDILLKRTQYKSHLSQLEEFRAKQRNLYKSATAQEQKKLIIQTKTRLEKELTENVFPAWYGTPWDFNGTSDKPGEGKIACGYFVSTTLKHIGFKINRFKLAQQPSQRIISTFMKRSSMDISSRRPMTEVKQKLMKTGNGIYIVGLDTHVGYVVVRDGSITFVHSSYYRPARKVVAEAYDTKNPLSDSKYRVVGKLFHDQMVINWLKQKPYTVAK